jgi:F-type H+-transporting ATPase subunit a
VKGQAEDQVGHAAHHYLAFFGTIFLFILTANLIGLIPIFESPTMNASVTAGCAFATFLYYNLAGVIAQGPLRYLAHFGGPMWWLAPLMFPIEVVSHLARLLSLTVRLYANMFAGEQVTLVFLSLTKFIGPVIFMGLHIFVGVIQAYIFMLLTMVYVGGAVAHDH